MCEYLFKILFSAVLDIYPEVGLPETGVVILGFLLFFEETLLLLFVVAAPFCIPTNNAKGSQFFHILTKTCYLLFFLIVATLFFIMYVSDFYLSLTLAPFQGSFHFIYVCLNCLYICYFIIFKAVKIHFCCRKVGPNQHYLAFDNFEYSICVTEYWEKWWNCRFFWTVWTWG